MSVDWASYFSYFDIQLLDQWWTTKIEIWWFSHLAPRNHCTICQITV